MVMAGTLDKARLNTHALLLITEYENSTRTSIQGLIFLFEEIQFTFY